MNQIVWRGLAWRDWVRHHSKSLTRCLISMFYLVNIVACVGTMRPDEDPEVHYLFHTLAQLLLVGGVFLFFQLSWRFRLSSKDASYLWDIAHSVVKYVAFSVAALWSVREMGKEIIGIVSENPAHSIMFAAAIGITFNILKQCSSTRFQSRFDPVLDAASSKFFLSGRERRLCAVHEAGHAALCAALQDLPSTFEVQISDHWNRNGPLGFVRFNAREMLLPRREVLYWQMLLLLAGGAAERQILGADSASKQSDAIEWEHLARTYLLSFETGSFFSEPKTMVEADWNSRKLKELQAELRGWLKAFMQVNDDKVRVIAAHLELKGRMTRSVAKKLLESIRFEERCPNPITPREESAAIHSGSVFTT